MSDHRRSRSPRNSHHHHHSHHRRKRTPLAAPLPFSSRQLAKHDYPTLESVFASYLDIQKSLILADLEHAEQRGRFKRFCNHYNRGDLARGWYERVTQQLSSTNGASPPPSAKRARIEHDQQHRHQPAAAATDNDDSDDSVVGPTLPGSGRRDHAKRSRHGPGAPKTDDLALQATLAQEDERYARADMRHERRVDRKQQKEQLDELVPRAEAGTRERQIEKKKEVNAKMAGFRERSPGGEVDESTLMGGGEDGFAQRKKAMERKKNERELRREQLLKARIAEREERMQVHREREERTMGMLKQLATRFQ